MEEVNKDIIKKLRVNERIKAREVRLVGEKGEQLGIMPLYQALEIARKQNFDLVEVAPNAVPPVCRLLDYGKRSALAFNYIQLLRCFCFSSFIIEQKERLCINRMNLYFRDIFI